MEIVGFITATPSSVVEVMYHRGITGMEISVKNGVNGADAIDEIMRQFGPEYENVDIEKCIQIMEASFSKIEHL